MKKPPAIVLHAPVSDPSKLKQFVEDCLKEGVPLIAICGEGCEDLEDKVDWIVIGDGTDDDRFIATTCHRDETIEEVLEFAACWDGGSEVRQVRL